jgi:hypothetical protein
MNLGQGFVFLRQIFNFLLEEPDFLGALKLDGIKFALQTHNLICSFINLAIFGLQLVKPIFNNS